MTWQTDAEGVPAWRASNNHSHSYLPLSGGTLQNTDFYPLTLIGGTTGAGIKFTQTGSDAKLGIVLFKPAADDWGMAMLNYSISKAIGIANDGTPYYGWTNSKNTLLHSGNYTSYKHAYTNLTGSGTTANQAIVSSGTANGWTLKTLGSNAFNSTAYLPLSGGTMTGALGKSSNYLIKPVADYRTNTGTHTGCIAITLPASIGNTMVSMWIDVYNYSTNESFSVHCGGYTYDNSTWQHNPFAIVYGASHRVRFGHNGTSFVIYIGETDSTWHYPQVTVRDVVLGFSPTYANWYKDWSISFVTSVSNVTAEITRYAITSSNIGSQSVNYATSAGKATNDSDGNAINSTYLKKSGGTMSGLLSIKINGYALHWGEGEKYSLGSNNTSDFYIWGKDTADLRIGTNNIERLRINGSGNVGIGTTSPSYKLHVNGSINGTSIYLNGTALSTASTHAHGDYVTAIGTSGNTLTWSKGGTAQTAITIPYATNSTSTEYLNNYLISDPNTANEDQKVKWFKLNSTVSGKAGYAGNNYGFPVSNNANGILWLGTHSGNYGGQLGISSNGSIYYRFISGGNFPTTADGGSWVKLVTSSNYTSYTVTKTGTGANGTWSINVTGSAGSVAWSNVSSKPETATRWPKWTEVTDKPSTFTPASHTHNYIEAKGNYTFDSSTLPNSFDYGISAGFVNSNSGFGSYGSVLTVRTFSGGGGTLQLYAPYSNTYGGSHLKARFGNYGSSSGNSWTTLKTIAWLDDIPSSLPANGGNSDTCDGLHVHSGRNSEANKIVRTDGSGYIQCGWINTTSGNFTGTPDRIWASNDAYMRYMTPANFFPTLANDSNQLSVTVGGQNRKLTIAYATNADTVDGQHLGTFWKHGSADPHGKSDKPWHKVATYTRNIASSQINTCLTLYISEYYNQAYGILTIRARAESGGATLSWLKLEWSLNVNIPVTNFIGTYKKSGNDVIINVYANRVSWSSYSVVKIEEQTWGEPRDEWTLIHATNSSNSYASIPSDETQVTSVICTLDNDISGNAATATKLKNTRKLWGNDFDGTANVGDTITLDAGDGGRQVRITKGGLFQFRAATAGWAGGLFASSNDGSTTLGAFGYNGSGDTLTYLFVGNNYNSPWVTFLPNGNVGIGTKNPSQKLEVNGSANIATLYEAGHRVITTANIGSQSVNYANSAGAVAWSNVSSKPGLYIDHSTDVLSYYNGTYTTLETGSYRLNFSGYTGSLIHFQFGGSTSGLDICLPYYGGTDIYIRKTIDSTHFERTSWTKLITVDNIGDSFKTINGQSIVGSGDITISGSESVNNNTLGPTAYVNGTTSELPHIVWHIPNVTWGNLSMDSSGNFSLRFSNSTSGSYANLYANLPDYLAKSGGTMTGTLKLTDGIGIESADGQGLLVHKPTNWTGVSGSQWGVGSAMQGVIRSNDTSLIHCRINGSSVTTYEIIDSKGGQTIADSLRVAGIDLHHTNEINGYNGNQLHLNYRVNTNISLVYGGGNVGVGTLSPSYKLHVNGDAGASNFYVTSDRNKKQNITTFSEHIRKFQLKDTEKWHYGVIAQEVPEMFRSGKEGNMTVNYNSVLSYYVGILENRVKELEDKIKSLETKQV